MSTAPDIIAGLDIGNGYTKGRVSSETNGKRSMQIIDFPSAAVLITRPNDTPDPDEQAPSVVTSLEGRRSLAFMNSLDVSFQTPLISDHYRRLFGSRALTASGTLDEFSVVGHISKAEQSLSHVLTLGALAAKALYDVVDATGALPADASIDVTVKSLALALPITEYRKHRKKYINDFTGTHTVTINNFETSISVRLVIAKVTVMPEGTSAQYAITELPASSMDLMLADVRAHGLDLEGITGDDVVAATNIMGIDIGEGTTNFPVFTDSKYNGDASTTFDRGYGSVLTDALEAMEHDGFNAGFTSRKQLADFLVRTPSALKRKHYAKVAQYVVREAEFFTDEVAERFGRVVNLVGSRTEIAYVYGGGSASIKNLLYPKLMAKVNEHLGDAEAFPVLYLDASYSRDLNREGLYKSAVSAAS